MSNRWSRNFAPVNPHTHPAYPHHSEYVNVPHLHPNEYVNVPHPYFNEYVNVPHPHPNEYFNVPHPHPNEYVNGPHPHPYEYISVPPHYANYPIFDPMVHTLGHPGHEEVVPYNNFYRPEAETTYGYYLNNAHNEVLMDEEPKEEQEEEINVVDVDEEINVLDVSCEGEIDGSLTEGTVTVVQDYSANSSPTTSAENGVLVADHHDENEIPLMTRGNEEKIIYIVKNGEVYCTKCMMSVKREEENVKINESFLEQQKALDLSKSAIKEIKVSSATANRSDCIVVNDSEDEKDC